MAKGDKKQAFIERTGGTEQDYMEHSRRVCEKRYFNTRTQKLLNLYGFDIIEFLSAKVAELQIPEECQSDKEYIKWVIKECQCPITIMREYINYSRQEDTTKEGLINTFLTKFPEESFNRFGDRNHMTGTIRKNYIDPEGQAIDVQIMEISELAGMEITEQDVIDFVTAYPKRDYDKHSIANQLDDAFYALTGFYIKDNYARKLLDMMSNKTKLTLEEMDAPF